MGFVYLVQKMESLGTSVRSTGLDALFQYTGTGVQLFSGMIFYVIVSRLFSTSGVGVVALFVAIIGLFNVVFSFGLGTAAQHFTSYNLGKGDYPSVRKTIYKIIGYGFALSILGFLALFAMSPLISSIFLHSDNYVGLVRALSIVLLGNILFGILNGAMLGIQNFRLSAILNVVIWALYYFGSLAMAVFLRSIDTIVIGWIIGVYLGVFLYLFIILRSVSQFKGFGKAPAGGFLFRYSFPILFSGMISYGAAYADRFVVSGLMTLSSLGVYTYALLIGTAIGAIATPFTNILLPKMSEFYGRGKKEEVATYVKVSSTLLSSLYVPAALGISALAPLILLLLGGIKYLGATEALRIITISSAVFIENSILVQAVAATRKTRIFIYSSAASLFSNIVISIVLIPRLGLSGAAIGFSSVYATSFVVVFLVARSEGLASFDITGITKVWLSAGVMYLAVSVVLYMTGQRLLLIPLYIALGVAVYIILARSLHVFERENKNLIISLFPENMKKIRRVISFLVRS